MIKKTPVTKLAIGMYISDLNCSWMDHPFVANHFEIKDGVTLDQVLAIGMRDVYIDTDKGLDVLEAQTRDEALQEIEPVVSG
jgi:hypothetical protein